MTLWFIGLHFSKRHQPQTLKEKLYIIIFIIIVIIIIVIIISVVVVIIIIPCEER